MIKTQIGAQRYNNKMDRIFKEAIEAKQRAKEFYQKVYNHLIKSKQEFCFIEDGRFIDRKYCLKYIND